MGSLLWLAEVVAVFGGLLFSVLLSSMWSFLSCVGLLFFLLIKSCLGLLWNVDAKPSVPHGSLKNNMWVSLVESEGLRCPKWAYPHPKFQIHICILLGCLVLFSVFC